MKKIIYNFKFFALATVMLFSFSCEENEYEDIVVPDAISFDKEAESVVLVSNDDTYELKVQSTTISDTDRVFNIEVIDESSDGYLTTASPDTYTVGNQVTIPAGEYVGSTTVTFDIEDLAFADPQDVVFNLVLGDFTLNNTRKEFVLSFERACPYDFTYLNIFTDAYPDETTWEVYDINISTTEPILSGGPLATASSTVSIPLCLAPGFYGVIVYDSYGDGIVSDGFTVVSGSGETLASSPVTGGGVSATFTIE